MDIARQLHIYYFRPFQSKQNTANQLENTPTKELDELENDFEEPSMLPEEDLNIQIASAEDELLEK